MIERLRTTVPVFVFLLNEDREVYLQRRYNTGYYDGYYEPAAGKSDANEFPVHAACRETMEETGVLVKPENLELFHSYMNLTGGEPWLGLMFRTREWEGTPSIQEPDHCDRAGFFSLDRLPLLTPQVVDGIARLATAHSIEMMNYTNLNPPIRGL